ncbi:peroxiredoxin Q/BCP [Bathymodiolus japonicus methanotrophic gill symbiont]|uniref:peroxiredoxin n=1 Tax=Bathymodiolus japonicus methanotrophic gill symbiont TaxID=113269 RepID=UPI001B6D49A8|nr:peroxiredoxin [Bathymodiolus japonicus methanotrophic gill symbiont]GFO71312.1 peroxiredoxin Q/BCP [Bathymodiolus japonicus methanotrophic gill symbiont]
MSVVSLDKPVADFSVPSTGDKNIQLSDYKGKYVLLYFYPRDNTPGCITEGQNFRDNITQIEQHNTVVLGVSRDSVRVHEGFKSKQNFPFDLLSDKDEELCRQFDVIKMKTMYGKKVLGIERSTFLIDPNGILIYEWRKVKVKVHIDEVLQKLAELGA